MFTPDMIAPCGLDCSLCSRAQLTVNPCPGCLGPDEHKPEFCAKRCGIILCSKRKQNGWRFCDVCPDYPCADVMEKETAIPRSIRSRNHRFRTSGTSVK